MRATPYAAAVAAALLLSPTAIEPVVAGENRSPVLATALDGSPLHALPRSEEARARLESALADARAAHAEAPTEMSFVWLGRRLAYLNRYDEAIAIYSEGLERYPDSYRLLRHRGHRYVSTRRFDLAITDLERAAALMPRHKTETEPDGIPNRLNQPLSNTQFNVLYHWGLAHYLKGDYERAAEVYRRCLGYAPNDDLRVAIIDWLWMTLRRLDQPWADIEASRLLDAIHPGMEIIENDSYLKRLLFYRGDLPVEALLETDAEDAGLALATQGYGVANWYFVNGDYSGARTMRERVLATGNWPAFGYIAAEADRHRGIPERVAADRVLDALHASAATAEWDAYFALFHPDARFLGTDAGEDWDVATLRRYAQQSDGWTYTPRERSVYLPSPDVVLFHELLDNERYGTSRGSGGLVWHQGRLVIAQYHLTFPIPNALAPELTERIRAYETPAPGGS